MSSRVVKREAQGAVSPDSPEIPTPTLTHFQQVAAQASAALSELAALIPNFEGQHPTTIKFVQSHLNVPLEFIETVTSAVEALPELQGTKKFDVEKARNFIQFAQAFRPVYDQVTAFARNLKFTMDAQRASVSADSLQMYHIAKGVARDPGSTDVASHVKNMKRDFGRKRRPRGTNPHFSR